MSIGGSIKHAFHHAAHQVEHGAKHAADQVSHEAKHDAHDAGKVAEQTAGDAAHAAGQGVSAIVDQVESSIESGVGAAVQKAVYRSWRVLEKTLMVAAPSSVQIQISFIGFTIDDPVTHVSTMAAYAHHPSFDRKALIGLVRSIGPDSVSLSVGAEAVELVVTSIDEEIQLTLEYDLDDFLRHAEDLIEEF